MENANRLRRNFDVAVTVQNIIVVMNNDDDDVWKTVFDLGDDKC